MAAASVLDADDDEGVLVPSVEEEVGLVPLALTKSPLYSLALMLVPFLHVGGLGVPVVRVMSAHCVGKRVRACGVNLGGIW